MERPLPARALAWVVLSQVPSMCAYSDGVDDLEVRFQSWTSLVKSPLADLFSYAGSEDSCPA